MYPHVNENKNRKNCKKKKLKTIRRRPLLFFVSQSIDVSRLKWQRATNHCHEFHLRHDNKKLGKGH